MRIFLLAATLLSLTTPALASELPPVEDLLAAAPARLVQVGKGPFVAHQMPDGRLLLVSSNGRFVVTGPVRDMWTGEVINSLDALDRAANRADLAGVDYDALGARWYGRADAPVVTMLVDPACPWCHRQLEVLRNDPQFLAEYRLALIPVAVLGRDSDLMLRSIECQLTPEAADAWFLTPGTQPFPAVSQDTPHCNPESVAMRIDLMRLLEAGGVPYTIAPDGRVLGGFRPDLRAWLEAQP